MASDSWTALTSCVPDRDKGKICIGGTYTFDIWANPYMRQQYYYYLLYPNNYAVEDGGVVDMYWRCVQPFDTKEFILKDRFARLKTFSIAAPVGSFYQGITTKGYMVDYDTLVKVTGTDCFPVFVGRSVIQNNVVSLIYNSSTGFYSSHKDAAGLNNKYEPGAGYIGNLSPLASNRILYVDKYDTCKIENRTIGPDTFPAVVLSRELDFYTGPDGATFYLPGASGSGVKILDTIDVDGIVYSSTTPDVQGMVIKFPIGTYAPAFKTRAGQSLTNAQGSAGFGIGILYRPIQPTLSVKNYTAPYSSIPSITLDTFTSDYGVVARRAFQFGVRKLKKVPILARVGHIGPESINCYTPTIEVDLAHSTVKKWVISDIYNINVTIDLKCVANVYKIIWNVATVETHLPVVGVKCANDVRWNETSNHCQFATLIVAPNAQAALDTLTVSAPTSRTRMSGPATRTSAINSGESIINFNSTFQLDIPYADMKNVHVTITFNSVGKMTVYSVTLDPLGDGTDEASRYGAWYINSNYNG